MSSTETKMVNATVLAERLSAIVEHAEVLLQHDNADRQGIAETLIEYVDRVVNDLRDTPAYLRSEIPPYYPMDGDR